MTASSNTAAGILVAVLALIPLFTIATRNPATTVTTSAETVTSSQVEPPPTVVSIQPPELEGLTESVVRVLISEGFATEEETGRLPASITRVLAHRDIALTIEEEG